MPKKFMLDEINVFDKGLGGILPQIGKNVMDNTGLSKIARLFTNPTGKGALLGSEAEEEEEEEEYDSLYGADGSEDDDPIDAVRTRMSRRRKKTPKSYGVDIMKGQDTNQQALDSSGPLDFPLRPPVGIQRGVQPVHTGAPTSEEIEIGAAPPVVSPPMGLTAAERKPHNIENRERGPIDSTLEKQLDAGQISEADYMEQAEARERNDIETQQMYPSMGDGGRLGYWRKKAKKGQTNRTGFTDFGYDAPLASRAEDFIPPEIQAQIRASTGKKITRYSELKRMGS